jgi:hypothetical protein
MQNIIMLTHGKQEVKYQEKDQLVEVFIDDKRELCEAATAEEVLPTNKYTAGTKETCHIKGIQL